MLVLSRNNLNKIILKNKRSKKIIEIVMVKAKDGNARIGITAPKEWTISRAELVERSTANSKPK